MTADRELKSDKLFDWVDPRTLKPDPNNPRRHISSIEVAELAQSLNSVGVIHPISVDPDRVVICGELRLRAALEAKLDIVPVRHMPSLTPAERLEVQAGEDRHYPMNHEDARDLLLRLRKEILAGRASEPPAPLVRSFRRPIPGHPEPPEMFKVSAGVFGSDEPETSRVGRPEGAEPGSERDLAARTGWSRSRVHRLLAEEESVLLGNGNGNGNGGSEPEEAPTQPDTDGVSERLLPLVSAGRLSGDAARAVEKRCPAWCKEQLLRQLEAAASSGFVETLAVKAVVEGLEVAGDNTEVAEAVRRCLTPHASGPQTKADVHVALAQLPDRQRQTEVNDAQRLARVMLELTRRLTSEQASRLGTFNYVAEATEKLLVALTEWRRTVIRASSE
jgi:hypothetical protein